jgi:RNA polymerase sigma-70 factor (ECF subfamily)
MDTDAELVDRLRAGDEAAFMALVGQFHQPMLRLARSMLPNPSLAEETVQDTWMGVVRGIDRFEGRSSLKTWLFRILANRARTTWSRERSDVPLDFLHSVDPARFDSQGQWADPLERWAEDSDARIDASAWSPILKAALDALPERQREVVLLRDVEGLSGDEVCSVLSINSGNQRILLHRGRARLRTVLEDKMKQD